MQFRTVLSSITGTCLVFATLLGSSGCDDLGTCDETKARTLIVNGEGQALYEGQAIMNTSCAAGQCHSSGATGSKRLGVPKGLDFNLQPAAVLPMSDKNAINSKGTWVDSAQLSTLRQNQRKVFDERNGIWSQLDKGLMPPTGVGADYRSAVPGANLVVKGAACQRGTEDVQPISASATKKIVRNWLACGAPVVEVSSVGITVDKLDKDPAGVPGTVGQQMPFCADCSAAISFEQLHANVFVPSCVSGCHAPGGAWAILDLSTVDKAYEELTSMKPASERKPACASKDFVVPGKPEDSYLVAIMGGKDVNPTALCSPTMPFGSAVLDCGLQQVTRWIKDGAAPPGAGTGADAGM